MVVINYNNREVSCKIVYYGPGLSGKTTNLQYVHSKVPGKTRGDLISLATDADRTLYFDFLPINIGDINGFTTKFQLYTVPGQVFYNATRKLVLRGVDGIVFVADSQAVKADENVESLNNLRENLAEYGLDLNTIPFAIQYNKRDLPGAMSVDELDELLNDGGWAVFEACASKGTGVFDTLKYVIKKVLDRAKRSPETMGQMGTHRVEDAQIPPDEVTPVESTAESSAVPSDISEDGMSRQDGLDTRVPISEPSDRTEPVAVPESGSQPTETGVRLAACAEQVVDSPGEGESRADAGCQTGDPTRSEPLGSVSAEESSLTAVATAPEPRACEEVPGVGSEEEAAVSEAKIDETQGIEGPFPALSSNRHGDDDQLEEGGSATDEKLFTRLKNLSEADGPDDSVADEELVERETFDVPTMQQSLRRRPKKKKKGFFLFRWLFRKD